ncbi:hypothetical protein EDD16DRAFT_1041228 [Pisolithus croceorrhizus]|nr:hypothetical protein EDD16DRAFT_1041228 [Pisolithus croceorrhizus]KAI6130224.1 hypothetical protein EV401DRAFT_2066308 [Pisolithus croceorrhizus]KAI6164499.1 hypothetical protein EDD17DRAFT_351405 [Pisolithus thermaeus]
MSTGAEVKDGLPVIFVSEDSEMLDLLLRFCYPCTLAEDPTLEDFRDAVNVFEVAKKYCLDAVERTICKSLFSPKMLETNSLRCFAIACRARMQNECALAAKYTLREPLVPMCFEEIELITSREFLSLLAYHKQCGNAVQALAVDVSWVTAAYSQWTSAPWLVGRYADGYCGCARSVSGRYPVIYREAVAQWWETFMDFTFVELRDKPCPETIRKNVERTIQIVRQRNCRHCSPVVPGVMRDFTNLFIRQIEAIIAEVRLDMKF